MKYLKLLIFSLIVVLPILVYAEAVYMKKEADGSVSFSDTPSDGAKPIKIEQPNIIENNKTKEPSQEAPENLVPPVGTPKSGEKPQQATPPGPELQKKETYTSVEITSPKNQETIWNPATVSVSVEVKYGDNKSGLQKGDVLVLLLDGRKVGDGGTSMSFTLNRDQIPRGEHTLQATVVNDSNTVLMTSGTITVFIQYTSVASFNRANIPISTLTPPSSVPLLTQTAAEGE